MTDDGTSDVADVFHLVRCAVSDDIAACKVWQRGCDGCGERAG